MEQVTPEIRDMNKVIRYPNRHSVASLSRVLISLLGPNFPGLDFVYITPDPGLPRLVGTDERVLRFVKMFGGVLILGRVATSYMSASQA
jgi:hypothetical protein